MRSLYVLEEARTTLTDEVIELHERILNSLFSRPPGLPGSADEYVSKAESGRRYCDDQQFH